MPTVDLDAVRREHSANFFENRSARHLYTVRLEDGIDIVRVQVVLINYRLFVAAHRELPHAPEVGPVSRYLINGPMLATGKHSFAPTAHLHRRLLAFLPILLAREALSDTGNLPDDRSSAGTLYDTDKEKFRHIRPELDAATTVSLRPTKEGKVTVVPRLGMCISSHQS